MSYYFEECGNFSASQFEEKISDAKRFLAKEFDVEESTIQQTRDSNNIGVTVGNRPTFAASIVFYDVVKDEKVVAYLEGHFSNAGDYMYISSNKL